MLENKNILLGVSGGIAAYKAVDLASRLTRAKARVRTVMTDHAQELVRPRSFQAVTGQGVYTRLWHDVQDQAIEHIELSRWADVIVVAPATANLIGKLAQGICDDLLTTLLCAGWQKPVLLAPAMNTQMWLHPAVQRNVAQVQGFGFKTVGPTAGHLACGQEGPGRMAEPERIVEAIEGMLRTEG